MRGRDEMSAAVDAIRDDPDLRHMSRIIIQAYSEARFQGFGDWDRARLVADALNFEGYRKVQS